MQISNYQEKYKQDIIRLILHIQNEEAKINLPLDEQPDLNDIPAYYQKDGGDFWVATENDSVIGTIAFMNYGNGNAVMKKFFVDAAWRNQKVGLKLYTTLLQRLEEDGYLLVLLDTPSVATASHRFYEKAGFKRISLSELPFEYHYPDRDSYLYLLKLSQSESIS